MKILPVLFLFVLLFSACGPVTPIDTNTLPTPVPQELQDFAYQMAWSPDDSMVALTTNTGLYVYDTKTYKQLAAFDTLGGATPVFSNTHLAAVIHEEAFVWNLKDFRLVFHQQADHESYFRLIAISPDEQTLVTVEKQQIKFWNLPARELVARMPSPQYLSDMVFSGSDRLLIADLYLGVIQEWDVQTQKQTRSIEFSRPVVNLNLSRDGKVVVVDYGDYGFETWNVDTGELEHEYPDIIGAPGWNNLSGDSRTAVVWGYGIGGESGLSVWDLSTHKKIFELATPLTNGDGWRWGVLNSDGTLLAASNNEGYIYFYELATGEKIGEIFLPYKFTT